MPKPLLLRPHRWMALAFALPLAGVTLSGLMGSGLWIWAKRSMARRDIRRRAALLRPAA